MIAVKSTIDNVLIGNTVYPAGSKIEGISIEQGLRLVASNAAEWVNGCPPLDDHQRQLAARLAVENRKHTPPPKPPTGYKATIRALASLIVDDRVVSPGETVETEDPWIVANKVGGGFAEMISSSGRFPPECMARFQELGDALARERKAAAVAPPAVNLGDFRPTLTPAPAPAPATGGR